jgi:hypothetical protein
LGHGPRVPRTGRRGARGSPLALGPLSCAVECPAGDEDTATAEGGRRLDQRAGAGRAGR